MKVVGIVAEYNPFHNGHKYQIEEIKREDDVAIVAVISGSFSQRGEPTILNKFERAEIALANGVDLVLELPFVYSCQNSETFAKGALKILNAIGITHLSFGAEDEDVASLYKIANIIQNPSDKYRELLSLYMSEGNSYIKANEMALLHSDSIDDCELEILRKPNNILGIEYIKAIIENDYNIEVQTVKRHMIEHDSSEVNESFASSTKIREMIYSKEDISKIVPIETVSAFKNVSLPDYKTFKSLLDYNLIINEGSGKELLDFEVGLLERVQNEFSKECDYSSAVEAVHSKRITKARARRFLSNYAVYDNDDDFIRESLKRSETYIRILGLNKLGASIIKNSNAETINRFNKINSMNETIKQIGEIELRANNIRSINTGEVQNLDYTVSPIIK